MAVSWYLLLKVFSILPLNILQHFFIFLSAVSKLFSTDECERSSFTASISCSCWLAVCWICGCSLCGRLFFKTSVKATLMPRFSVDNSKSSHILSFTVTENTGNAPKSSDSWEQMHFCDDAGSVAVFVCQSLKLLFFLLFFLSQWQRPCVQSSVTVDVLGLTWATAAIGSVPAAAPAPRTPTASYVQLHPASSYISLIVSCLPTQAPASVSHGPPPLLCSVCFSSFPWNCSALFAGWCIVCRFTGP